MHSIGFPYPYHIDRIRYHTSIQYQIRTHTHTHTHAMTMTILRPPLIQTVVEDILSFSWSRAGRTPTDRTTLEECQLQSEAVRNCSCAAVSLLVASCTHAQEKLPKVKFAPQEPYPIVTVLEQSQWYGTALFQTNVQSQDGSSSVVLSVGVLPARDQKKERCWNRKSWIQ